MTAGGQVRGGSGGGKAPKNSFRRFVMVTKGKAKGTLGGGMSIYTIN